MSDSGEEKVEDIFKILVATDIHLGFEETDPIRDQDTFDTFEEILMIGVENDVDFILLGGDLFHHARPSPYALNKCLELLRKYCLGAKPISIEYLSDPQQNLHNNKTVNYEDPNLNVSIPVFSIHGNHDDPTGHKQVSALDLIASSGLINYFGRWENYDQVDVKPIFLKKGESKLALYGLSHIKDERLGRLFLDRKFKLLVTEDQDEWFHLLVLHQNRATRGVKNFIPDNALPEFLDLAIWGHEHDCRIQPEVKFNDVYISQPGSSVATSLAAGEAIPKKVGILKIHKRNFKMEPIELRTVRPFIYDELVLKSYEEMADQNDKHLPPSELTMEIIKNKISSMIESAKNLGRVGRAAERPLIRLNVKCRDETQVIANTIRFGQAYSEIVANPNDIVKCNVFKEVVRHKGKKSENEKIGEEIVLAARVEDMVTTYFNEHDVLKFMNASALNEAVKKYVDSHNIDAVSEVVRHLKEEALKNLVEQLPDENEIDDIIRNFRLSKEDEGLESINKLLDDTKHVKNRSVNMDSDKDMVTIDDDDDDDDNGASSSTPVQKRGRGTATRGTRGIRRQRRARGTASIKNSFLN